MTQSLRRYLLRRKTGETMDYRRFQKQLEFLLENACPNIQYRVKKEILKEATDSLEMLELQAKISVLPKVKKHLLVNETMDFLVLLFTVYTLTASIQQLIC